MAGAAKSKAAPAAIPAAIVPTLEALLPVEEKTSNIRLITL